MSSDTTQSKNILLIIDPQNDFSEANSNEGRGAGSLAVTGSNEDYKRIIELINQFPFDEIHVSLDTHTPYHIGHSRFYEGGNDESNYGFNFFDKDTHIPVKVPSFYTEKYNKAHHKARKSNFMIWADHCLEESNGHNIVKELHDVLEKKDNVRYHIKGQNELSEMYSIFSATVNPKSILNTYKQMALNIANRTKDENEQLKKIKDGKLYDGKYKSNIGNYNKAIGCETYEEAAKSVNLDTTRNDDLLKNLFGGDNKIYVCGQARTHCVKDSVKDMLKYAKDNKKKSENVVLIHNCSSPIAPESGGVDDIIDILRNEGGSWFNKHTDLLEKKNPFPQFDRERKEKTGSLKKVQGSINLNLGGKRRTRKRSKRTKRRSQRKQKRSHRHRKRTRRSRR